jgi:hypothetical protein
MNSSLCHIQPSSVPTLLLIMGLVHCRNQYVLSLLERRGTNADWILVGQKFDELLGLKYLKRMHIANSKTEFGLKHHCSRFSIPRRPSYPQ